MERENALCLDCRWCQAWVDPYGGSHYLCERSGLLMSSTTAGQDACRLFRPRLSQPRA